MAEYLRGTGEVNGDGDTIYPGVEFTSETDLLTKFRDTLTGAGAGWTIVLDDIAANKRLELQGSDGTNSCYINLEVITVNASNYILRISGDVDGTGKTQNADSDEIYLDQACKPNEGKLYISASDKSFCFVIRSDFIESIPYYAGFPITTNSANPGLWGFGTLSSWRMSKKFIAEWKTGDYWREVQEFYNSASEPATYTSTVGGCQHRTLDPTVQVSGATQTLNANNANYKPETGALGIDGKAKLKFYGIDIPQNLYGAQAHIEGEATAVIDYGNVEFARRGLSSLPSTKQIIEEVSSVSYAGTERGYQSFAITD